MGTPYSDYFASLGTGALTNGALSGVKQADETLFNRKLQTGYLGLYKQAQDRADQAQKINDAQNLGDLEGRSTMLGMPQKIKRFSSIPTVGDDTDQGSDNSGLPVQPGADTQEMTPVDTSGAPDQDARKIQVWDARHNGLNDDMSRAPSKAAPTLADVTAPEGEGGSGSQGFRPPRVDRMLLSGRTAVTEKPYKLGASAKPAKATKGQPSLTSPLGDFATADAHAQDMADAHNQMVDQFNDALSKIDAQLQGADPVTQRQLLAKKAALVQNAQNAFATSQQHYQEAQDQADHIKSTSYLQQGMKHLLDVDKDGKPDLESAKPYFSALGIDPDFYDGLKLDKDGNYVFPSGIKLGKKQLIETIANAKDPNAFAKAIGETEAAIQGQKAYQDTLNLKNRQLGLEGGRLAEEQRYHNWQMSPDNPGNQKKSRDADKPDPELAKMRTNYVSLSKSQDFDQNPDKQLAAGNLIHELNKRGDYSLGEAVWNPGGKKKGLIWDDVVKPGWTVNPPSGDDDGSDTPGGSGSPAPVATPSAPSALPPVAQRINGKKYTINGVTRTWISGPSGSGWK